MFDLVSLSLRKVRLEDSYYLLMEETPAALINGAGNHTKHKHRVLASLNSISSIGKSDPLSNANIIAITSDGKIAYIGDDTVDLKAFNITDRTKPTFITSF